MSPSLLVILYISILAYALVAGVFLAFSDFIMRSFAISDDASGVETMQAINREVFRWVFMTLFLGMAAISVGIVAVAAFNLSNLANLLALLAGLFYLLGCFGVTVARNVPLNEALAGYDRSSHQSHRFWRDTYLPKWTFWNTVRTVAATIAAALLLLSLVFAGHG